MLSEEFHLSDTHLSDQEMLLAVDGELPTRRAAQIHEHLTQCWSCRARMAEIEATIADFARAHRQTLDPQLPPIEGSRALLRARLAELASEQESNSWRRSLHFTLAARVAVFLCTAFLIAAVVGGILLRHSARHVENSTVAGLERGALPDRRLTPGATRGVTIGEACSMAHEEVVGEVSSPLRQEVFREYGIVNAHPDDYEVDYLIAPGLGGAEDIHNLWPEPYTSRPWNAHVKDALEERLHEMVCGGELDLSTAQRDIATDWIAAYKKYFHTDRPLALHSRLETGSVLVSGGVTPQPRQFSLTESMINFGTMRPKLIAKIMRMAIHPSASVALKSPHVFCELLVSCTSPLAILNRKTPGIMETTEAKPIAANGMCQRRDTGARITPTTRHATKAPVTAPAPSAVRATHLRAWATAPTATGQGSILRGAEKKIL
jgi:predicted anti-sigma-YlaC factor YlaD